MLDTILLIVFLILLVLSFLVVGMWHKRPIISVFLASLFVFMAFFSIGLFQIFKALLIYGTGDPQLMAGAISESIVTAILKVVLILPVLILFQWIMRRRWQSRVRNAVALKGFE